MYVSKDIFANARWEIDVYFIDMNPDNFSAEQ